jgi:hypothetical protein
MRMDCFKAALLAAAIGTGGLVTTDANATSRMSSGDAKRAQAAAADERHERMRLCRKQSYARMPGGGDFPSEARWREIEQCYMNGGRLM